MLNYTTGLASPEEQARLFRALSVDTRVRMLVLLGARSMCVGALARALGITAAAVSQHLRVLRDLQLVTASRRGHFVHYSLNTERLHQWWTVVDSLFRELQESPSPATPCGGTRKEVDHECGEEGLSEAGEPEGQAQ
ncbi:MAG: metalloregulator ArsR/SmtB family transcription factor [Candidatus Bipolaricaulota bacterium]